jgi:hypothetical protein
MKLNRPLQVQRQRQKQMQRQRRPPEGGRYKFKDLEAKSPPFSLSKKCAKNKANSFFHSFKREGGAPARSD